MKFLAVDRDLQVVRVLQRLRHRDRDVGGELRRERPAPHQFGQILPVDVLHRDVEESVGVARIVDPHHVRIDGGQVGLQFRPAALGLDGIARVGIGGVFDQLQRDRWRASVSCAR